MAAARSASLKLDWTSLSSTLGLTGRTASSLAAFKKRNDDARRKLSLLQSQSQSVDFSHYRSLLANTAIVDEIEGKVKEFRAKKFDLGRQLKAIEAFESQAVDSAMETKRRVDEQVVELEAALKDIRATRAVEDLTVDDVCKAEPRIEEYTAKMVYRGQWQWPGYQEKFGSLALL